MVYQLKIYPWPVSSRFLSIPFYCDIKNFWIFLCCRQNIKMTLRGVGRWPFEWPSFLNNLLPLSMGGSCEYDEQYTALVIILYHYEKGEPDIIKWTLKSREVSPTSGRRRSQKDSQGERDWMSGRFSLDEMQQVMGHDLENGLWGLTAKPGCQPVKIGTSVLQQPGNKFFQQEVSWKKFLSPDGNHSHSKNSIHAVLVLPAYRICKMLHLCCFKPLRLW